MTVTYTWSIKKLTTIDSDSYQDVVQIADWEVTGSDGSNTATSSGSTALPFPVNGFVDYSKLKEEEVIKWVQDNTPELRMNELTGTINAKLKQITQQDKPLPWTKSAS